MAVNINVPSQVKTYANLAAFPATGALKTIYIAEDTNKTYRWTGSVYTEISASAAMTWGAIGGTLSNQTDLQSALDAKVPTSRTLTINGVTQDLSADRTFTISTGITIGSTAIASGTVGRILFEGAGNVVQQSSSLFWDSTNNRLGIGTSSPSFDLDVNGTARVQSTLGVNGSVTANTASSGTGYEGYKIQDGANARFVAERLITNFLGIGHNSVSGRWDDVLLGAAQRLYFYTGASERARFAVTTGNFLINTTTDAGFRLDVNGTARVQDRMDVAGNNGRLVFRSPELSTRLNGIHWTNPTDTGSYGYIALSGGTGEMRMFTSSTYFPTFYSNGSERMRIPTTGNVLINTTTDAGYRLDVNGTARVSGNLTIDNLNCNAVRGSFFNTINNGFTVFQSFTASGNAAFYNSVSVGTTATPVSSAVLEAVSTTKGFLPPRMTTTQKNAIATPAAGLVVYDTTLNKLCVYTTAWETVTSL